MSVHPSKAADDPTVVRLYMGDKVAAGLRSALQETGMTFEEIVRMRLLAILCEMAISEDHS